MNTEFILLTFKEISEQNVNLLFLIPAAILIGYFGTVAIRMGARKSKLIDVPNERSSHTIPTPRGGGIAIVVAFLILLPLTKILYSIPLRQFWGLYISSLAITILGFLDDFHSLSRTSRIFVWVLITCLSLIFGIELQSIEVPILGIINFRWFSPFITFLWLIGLTNFFNFMDGINGLAGFEALIVSGFLAGFAYSAGNMLVYSAAVIIFGSVLGFLPHNFPRSKIFLGDSGSNFLGYMFAALTIIGSQSNQTRIPFVIPVILLMIFLLDAGSTLIKRIPKGKDWLEPHREHYYQKLIHKGYTHTQVTMAYSVCNLVLGGIALLYSQSSGFISLGVFIASVFPFLGIVYITEQFKKNSLQ